MLLNINSRREQLGVEKAHREWGRRVCAPPGAFESSGWCTLGAPPIELSAFVFCIRANSEFDFHLLGLWVITGHISSEQVWAQISVNNFLNRKTKQAGVFPLPSFLCFESAQIPMQDCRSSWQLAYRLWVTNRMSPWERAELGASDKRSKEMHSKQTIVLPLKSLAVELICA